MASGARGEAPTPRSAAVSEQLTTQSLSKADGHRVSLIGGKGTAWRSGGDKPGQTVERFFHAPPDLGDGAVRGRAQPVVWDSDMKMDL
jgi:hypothetical protein